MASDLVWCFCCCCCALVASLATSLYFILKFQVQQEPQPQHPQHQGDQFKYQEHQQPQLQRETNQVTQVWVCKTSESFHTSKACRSLKGNSASRLQLCQHCCQVQNLQENLDHQQ